MPLSDSNKLEFQRQLLAWFQQAGRDFPWRSQSDPYAILVAEKLLQQTAARDVVVRAYEQFLYKYPTPWHLAAANVSDIQEIIQSLGLRYRAKEFSLLAQELVDRHGGKVPQDLRQLLALTGVGDYTARAVLSFAFGKNIPVVDTNVARFLYRLYGIPGPLPANPARKKSLIELASGLIPSGRSRDFNLAILDLCAQICKPATPLCTDCPVQVYCVLDNMKGEVSCP